MNGKKDKRREKRKRDNIVSYAVTDM